MSDIDKEQDGTKKQYKYPSLTQIHYALRLGAGFIAEAEDLVAYLGGGEWDSQSFNDRIKEDIKNGLDVGYPEYSVLVLGDLSDKYITIEYVPISFYYKINLTPENIKDELQKTYNQDIDIDLEDQQIIKRIKDYKESERERYLYSEASLAHHLGIAIDSTNRWEPLHIEPGCIPYRLYYNDNGGLDVQEDRSYVRTLKNVDIYNHNYQGCDKDVINILLKRLGALEEKENKERVVTTLDKALVDKIDDIKIFYKKLFNGRLPKTNQMMTELIILGLYKLDDILVDLLKNTEGADKILDNKLGHCLDLDSIDLTYRYPEHRYKDMDIPHTSIIEPDNPLYQLTNWEKPEKILKILQEAVDKER